MRGVVLALVSGASLSIVAPRALRSQGDSVQTANGMCSRWVSSRGQTEAHLDSIYSRCALESRALLYNPPGFSRFASIVGGLNASLVVVVNADGGVNLKLTRAASAILPPAFDEGVYQLLERWRVAPGRLARRSVRSALPVVLQVPTCHSHAGTGEMVRAHKPCVVQLPTSAILRRKARPNMRN